MEEAVDCPSSNLALAFTSRVSLGMCLTFLICKMGVLTVFSLRAREERLEKA